MNLSYDVVIVGAGPAGTAAACVLAKRGISVAVLDRATFPRKKLCGGLLTWKTVRTLEHVFGLDEAGLRSAGLVDFSADSYSLLLRGREISRDSGFSPFLLVDRTTFDSHLLQLAERAGAEVFPATSVAQCSPGRGVVATASGTKSGSREFAGRYLIGADGANSRLRRTLGVDRSRWYKGLARAVEFHIAREQAPRALRELAEPQLHVGYNTAGYGWVFPNSDRLCIGMCGLQERSASLQSQFSNFLETLEIDSENIDLKGHPLPYGNWLEQPCHGRLLLAGDAAGFVEPLLGEGIFYALATGRYAGEAIADALEHGTDPATAYVARLQRYIIPELQGSRRMRQLFLMSIRLVGYAPFRMFMRFAAKPLISMVHGHRSYRFMRPKHWDF